MSGITSAIIGRRKSEFHRSMKSGSLQCRKKLKCTLEIIKSLLEKIILVKPAQKRKVIALCGAADLGKSWLCKALVEALSVRGFSANYLTIDSYLIPRLKRTKLGISGYNIDAYNIRAATKDLAHYLNNKTIYCHEYNHEAGQCDGTERIIQPCSYLVLDGVQSMAQTFMSYIDFSVFIYTDDRQLQQIRHQANLIKRKQSEEFSLNNMQTELNNYKEHIEPYRKTADIEIELIRKWQYVLREK